MAGSGTTKKPEINKFLQLSRVNKGQCMAKATAKKKVKKVVKKKASAKKMEKKAAMKGGY